MLMAKAVMVIETNNTHFHFKEAVNVFGSFDCY